MPVYRCRVADSRGRIGEVLHEAASEDACLRELGTADAWVVAIAEAAAGGARPRRCPRRLVQDLTDLLALTLGSGLSLRDALEVSRAVFARAEGDALVTLVLERLKKGVAFSEALAAAGRGFPAFYLGMVRVGERVGTLEQVFGRLARQLKDEKALRDRLSAALVYPAIVLAVAAASAAFIVTFVVPRLREVFAELGPATAAGLESLVDGLTAAAAALAAVLGAAAVLAVAAVAVRRRGGAGARRVDRLILAVPLVAKLATLRDLLSFTFAMETLTGAGVGVEEALPEGAATVVNLALRHELLSARERVVKGERLSAAFARCPLVPARVARWMAIGERIGQVEKVFGQLRGHYQLEVDTWISRVMALVEPALVVGLGVLVIAFVVFFILPVFSAYAGMP